MKKEMKLKAFINILLLFLILFQLTGCSNLQPHDKGNQTQNAANAKEDDDNKVTNIQFAQWSVTALQHLEETISRFNERNREHIYVDIVKIPLERYAETLNMLNSSGDGPDVYEIVREWHDSYVYKGWIADLMPYLEKDFVKAYPVWAVKYADNNNSNSGKLYSLPSTLITYRLIYNKDLFRESGLDPEAPPRTLAELERFAKIISDHEKGKRKYGFAQPMGEFWMDFVIPMEAVNAYSGVYFYDFENKKYDLTVYEPWLQTLQRLNKEGGMFPGMDSMKSDLALAQFAEGNIGMMFAASWQVSAFFNHLPPKCSWGVAMPPVLEDAGRGTVMVNTAGWNVVNAQTSKPEEAVSVWKFLYSGEYLGSLSSKYSVIPVVEDMMKEPAYQLETRNFKMFLPGDEDSVYPNTPRNQDEWLRKNAYMEAFKGDLMDEVLLKETYRLNSLNNVTSPSS